VKKRFSLEMKKERFRTYEAAEAMAAAIPWQSETTFSLFERRPGAKCELAAFILAQEASYKNWDGGTRNSMVANFAGAPTVIRALPEVREDRWRPYCQKLKIQNVASITVFFLLRFSGNHRDTLRIQIVGKFIILKN
jgi:hypothetical protein